MQTTLRIDDELYREAKSCAAREGVTLTKFLEEALKLRLQKPQSRTPYHFRVYESETPFPFRNEDLKRIDQEEQERYDLEKLRQSSRATAHATANS
jgi:hypothetical protein